MIMTWLVGVAASWMGRLGIIAGGMLLLVWLRAWDVSRLKSKGRAEVVQASKQAGAKANATNDKVRAAAREPGAAERLRRDKATCSDC